MCSLVELLTMLSSSRPGHWSMRFSAPLTGGPGSVAGLPVPLRLVVALAPRFDFDFLPFGASVSFCEAQMNKSASSHSFLVPTGSARCTTGTHDLAMLLPRTLH